jgi:hypothetical protein
VLHLARHPRWKRVLAAASLPYVVVSLCVDIIHVHGRDGRQSSAAVRAEQSLEAATQVTKGSDYSCPACVWLRVHSRLGPRVSTGTATRTAPSAVEVAAPQWPDAPTPPSTAVRGPPLRCGLA